MAVPPKPPQVQVVAVTHHSAELSWAPYHAKLSAALHSTDADRLKVEVQLSRGGSESVEPKWEVAYRGYDTRCVCYDLEDSTGYRARFRFGNASSGWGDFSEPAALTTARRRYTGEDVHRYLRRQDEARLVEVLLAREASIDTPDPRGYSPLQLAAVAGWRKFCELLIGNGAEVDWCGDSGKTALMMSAYRGAVESLELLLDSGAAVGKRDRLGATALHYAVDGEKLDAVRLLLARGADPTARDSAGRDPMTRCAMLKNNGNSDVATALLQAGANPNCPDSMNQTSLFYCCLNDHLRMAECLLSAGAKPRLPNFNGVTALAVAEASQKRALRDMLMRHAAKRSQ